MSHTTVAFVIGAGFMVGALLAGGTKILLTLREEKRNRFLSDRWRREGWVLATMAIAGAFLIAAVSIWVVVHP